MTALKGQTLKAGILEGDGAGKYFADGAIRSDRVTLTGTARKAPFRSTKGKHACPLCGKMLRTIEGLRTHFGLKHADHIISHLWGNSAFGEWAREILIKPFDPATEVTHVPKS